MSHFHPDHHFGLQVLKNAFPAARIVALPSVVKGIVFTSSDKIGMWATGRFGPDDIPRRTTIPVPLHEPRLLLEGEEIIVSDGREGDSANNSVVWVPSIGVVCATDVAFHDCRLWPIESNVARRVRWRASIDKLREFDARIVIPGHCDHAKVRLMEEAREKGWVAYTECIDWSLAHPDNYEEVYNAAGGSGQNLSEPERRVRRPFAPRIAVGRRHGHLPLQPPGSLESVIGRPHRSSRRMAARR